MSLTVVVCVKQVLYAGLPHVLSEDGCLDLEDETRPIYSFNPADRSALELAVRLKENARAHVIALTLGPGRAQEALKICLARGADAAVHLVCPEGTEWDAWQSAGLVARELRHRKTDLALCGEESLDNACGVFGPFLAERLGWPQVTRVEALELQGEDRILVRRQLEHGDREVLACPLPAAVSIRPFAEDSQYVPVLRVLRIASERIERRPVDCEEPPLSQLRRVEVRAPRARPRHVLTPATSLGAAERISFLMSGPHVRKDTNLFEGSPHQAAEKIFEFLKERGFV